MYWHLPAKPQVKDESIAKIWTLSAQDIDDDEIVSSVAIRFRMVKISILTMLSQRFHCFIHSYVAMTQSEKIDVCQSR